jgi:hypothetical protein
MGTGMSLGSESGGSDTPATPIAGHQYPHLLTMLPGVTARDCSILHSRYHEAKRGRPLVSKDMVDVMSEEKRQQQASDATNPEEKMLG